jgi:hypothetical protein
MSYTVYACNQNGEGYSQKIGTFDSLDEIRLRVGLFAPDVILEIEDNQEEKMAQKEGPKSLTPATTATIPNIQLK